MKHQDLTDKIIGVFYEVYNELGHGFLESVYEKAMIIAFEERGISAPGLINGGVYIFRPSLFATLGLTSPYPMAAR